MKIAKGNLDKSSEGLIAEVSKRSLDFHRSQGPALQSHQQRIHSIPFSLKVEENAINFSAVSHLKNFWLENVILPK